MKINETTPTPPPVPRTFTLELSQTELELLVDRLGDAPCKTHNGVATYDLWNDFRKFVFANKLQVNF